ncbi:hypothetical protein DDZ13_15135 [Coraliomargarita sinensis]|uniref:Uncharacterized protein n=1 Tax=Coraliomargarita sinensis TaxID=2174842 RepID=A0A317ZGC6_9BACT|nr:hypothetical protein DDZ13_15135 [Coraliomargarita sinensis]
MGDVSNLVLLAIFAVFPIYVLEFQGIIPFISQNLIIIVGVGSCISLMKKANKRSIHVFLSGVAAYIALTLISNMLLLRIFDY